MVGSLFFPDYLRLRHKDNHRPLCYRRWLELWQNKRVIPVGGFFTIDAKIATEVCRQLAPRMIIPMHYKTDKCGPDFPISSVEDFLKGKENVTRLDTSEAEFRQGELPATTQIIVMPSAL